MTKAQAIALLYHALMHSEGISELMAIGINVCDLQQRMETAGLVRDVPELDKHAGEACEHILGEIDYQSRVAPHA